MWEDKVAGKSRSSTGFGLRQPWCYYLIIFVNVGKFISLSLFFICRRGIILSFVVESEWLFNTYICACVTFVNPLTQVIAHSGGCTPPSGQPRCLYPRLGDTQMLQFILYYLAQSFFSGIPLIVYGGAEMRGALTVSLLSFAGSHLSHLWGLQLPVSQWALRPPEVGMWRWHGLPRRFRWGSGQLW